MKSNTANVYEATTVVPKKRAWKTILKIIIGLLIIYAAFYCINYHYDNQLQNIINNAIDESANSAVSDLKTLNINYILNSMDTSIPKAQKYSLNELTNSSGKVATAFQYVKYNNANFSEVFKVGKSIEFLQFTRTIGVYTNTDNNSFNYNQFIGNVKVTFTAFYQSFNKSNITYYTNVELDTTLQNFINSYKSIQDEKIFEKSFELVESSVDYDNKTITFYYNWTNLYNEPITPMWSFELNAYQNNHELNMDYDNSETGSLIELAPNYTGEYSITYNLQDIETPVKLVVSNIYGENLFVNNPPTMEFVVEVLNENAIYESIQDEKIFEKSFELVESSVDYDNKTITFYYNWTNLYNEPITPMWSFELNAYQDNTKLNKDYDNSETGSLIELAPNYTGEYSITYNLQNTTVPVKLVVSNIYGENLFVDNPPTMEFEIALLNENISSNIPSSSFSGDRSGIFGGGRSSSSI